MIRGSYIIGCVQCAKGRFIIRGLNNLNRAINGDKVAIVEIKDSSTTEAESDIDDDIIGLDGGGEDGEIVNYCCGSNDELLGRVVGIISRNFREIAGSLQPLQLSSSTNSRIFMPIDSRIPFINIKTRMSKELEGKRITVKIADWPADSKRPNGYWVRILGDIGHVDVETWAILIENSITVDEFSDSAHKELPLSSWIAEPQSGRIEWTDTTVSVDPPGCTDIDDALSYKKIENNLRIGVHIADVSHFVKDGSALDMEASKRCNTVYLVDRRHEMLPELLTSNICSLRSNVHRYAFSVIWTMDLEGNILDTKFTKSIICSSASLTYEQAHQIIQGHISVSSEVKESLTGLLEISAKLRQKRIEKGALELASAEVSFDYDESSQIRGLRPYKLYPTNQMVEEFMLLANTSVAKKLTNTFPCTIIRRHPLPQLDKLEELNNTLKSCGFGQLRYNNSKELNESLQNISRKHPHIERILRILSTRCMSQAVYSNSKDVPRLEWHHYGLCVDVYTHFTSPIRRYADILVHRLLEAALEISTIPEGWNRKLTESCDHMNDKCFASKRSSRASIELFSYYLFKKSGPKVTKGIVTALRNSGITVMCPEFGIQVFASSANKTRPYKLFDQIDVKLESHDRFSRFSVIATV
ncbi:exosome complex exonuclease DIS3/RRP44 [Babesia microti strain RI]|uniref:Exosome complex exonuclease DIS3/RRP44 n=1 Tax=Babesia microti (strain RI) TaxID=1133968 RepID=A0A1R4AB04_BABMR|nr:exosome complex exonuclease DIS3/RRP44 [Babesia microti strain RI]SJK86178.1 exosome complex exonuclease DIS3/RRP44 [Babesia microti strain RI]|eukprot:XP_012648595.2 exosome complex exonuclease DIS3/RRP44 [Babesia microti strain RI]